METLRKARPELQETLKTQDHRNSQGTQEQIEEGAAEIVEKRGLGAQTAYVCERESGTLVSMNVQRYVYSMHMCVCPCVMYCACSFI